MRAAVMEWSFCWPPMLPLSLLQMRRWPHDCDGGSRNRREGG